MTSPNPSPSELPERAAPALSLAAFVESVAERLSAAPGTPALHVSGARGSGAPLIAMALARKLQRRIVYVAPDADGAEAAARDLRYLLNDPGVGCPDASAEEENGAFSSSREGTTRSDGE